MTNEERDLITRFIARAAGAPQGGGFAGSVPAAAPALPPIDPDANALIKDLFTRYPEAAYRITQMAVVEEQALVEAQNRFKRLEWELDQARQQAQQAQEAQAQAAPSRPSRGLFGGLFGGGSAPPPPQQPPQQPPYQQQYQPPPPPPPQYGPGYQPGMFQRSGSGFLGSALSTAAGVAGGVLAADALSNLFSGHHGGIGGGGFGGGETIIEQSPWAAQPAGGAAANPWDTVQNQNDPNWDTASNTPAAPAADQGGWDTASNDPAPGQADQGGGWDDQSSAPDPGFDNSGMDDSGGGFDNS